MAPLSLCVCVCVCVCLSVPLHSWARLSFASISPRCLQGLWRSLDSSVYRLSSYVFPVYTRTHESVCVRVCVCVRVPARALGCSSSRLHLFISPPHPFPSFAKRLNPTSLVTVSLVRRASAFPYVCLSPRCWFGLAHTPSYLDSSPVLRFV